MQKLFYILVCDGTNSYVDPVLLGTYCIIDARHELFLDSSTSITFLVFLAPVIICIVWHMLYSIFLSTCMFLNHSASEHFGCLAHEHFWITWHILRS